MSISQLALARRYRPKDFKTVVGQEATLRALMSALDTKRLHHAYLFTGTRGVGKTTLARIFAKALNCEQGVSANPCNRCDTCQAINNGAYVDLIEVDAASRTKVEDTRELLDNVQYLPTRGRYKIYLIDEVHMLSTHSFNALLKTLEEPPSYVIFLLATTDPQKMPITVLSRCLQFHLQCLPCAQIIEHLAKVLLQEKAEYEVEALEVLARAADGSMRDALSLLDQALAYGQSRIVATEVRALLGLTEKGRLIALLSAIIALDAKQALQEIATMASKNANFTSVLTELLVLLSQIAIASQVPEAIDENAFDPKIILQLAEQTAPEEIQLYYQIALLGQKDLPYAPSPKIGFEMIVLRMLAFQPVTVGSTEAQLGTSLETQVVTQAGTQVGRQAETKTGTKAGIATETMTEVAKNENRESKENQQEKNAKVFPVDAAAKAKLSEWSSLIPALNLSGMTKELAQHCTVAHWLEDQIHFLLDETQKPLANKRNEERLQEALSEYFKRPMTIKIITDSKLKARALENQSLAETPAQQYQKLEAEAKQKARHSIENDPKVLQMMEKFSAKIEQVVADESIKDEY